MVIPFHPHLLVGNESLRNILPRRHPIWPLLFSSIGFCLLISLGVWQLQRLTWKQNLIAQIQTQQDLPRVELSSALITEPIPFRHVYTEGIFDYGAELRLLGRTVQNIMGYYVFTPLQLRDGRQIYVSRGWVSNTVQDYEISRPSGPVRVEGVLREKMSRNLFTPTNHLEQQEIYAFDPQELGQDNLIPYYIEATHITPHGEYPRVIKQEIHLRNHHLLYALTWFALAGGLAIVCFLFIRKKQ